MCTSKPCKRCVHTPVLQDEAAMTVGASSICLALKLLILPSPGRVDCVDCPRLTRPDRQKSKIQEFHDIPVRTSVTYAAMLHHLCKYCSWYSTRLRRRCVWCRRATGAANEALGVGRGRGRRDNKVGKRGQGSRDRPRVAQSREGSQGVSLRRCASSVRVALQSSPKGL